MAFLFTPRLTAIDFLRDCSFQNISALSSGGLRGQSENIYLMVKCDFLIKGCTDENWYILAVSKRMDALSVRYHTLCVDGCRLQGGMDLVHR